jgi:hypothetical protein
MVQGRMAGCAPAGDEPYKAHEYNRISDRAPSRHGPRRCAGHRPSGSHPFRARPRPQSEYGPHRRRNRGDPDRSQPPGVSLASWHVRAPSGAAVAADDDLLPADLALGVGHAAFLRRFRPRHTVFKNLSGRSWSRVTGPQTGAPPARRFQLVTAMGTTPSMYRGQLCRTAGRAMALSHKHKQSVRNT